MDLSDSVRRHCRKGVLLGLNRASSPVHSCPTVPEDLAFEDRDCGVCIEFQGRGTSLVWKPDPRRITNHRCSLRVP